MLELWHWQLAKGERYESPGHSAGTREILHVEKGSISVEIAGAIEILRAPAAAVFEADVPHAYAGQGAGMASFTMVVEEPGVRKRC